MLTAEDILSFAQGQRYIANTIQTLKRLALEGELTSREDIGIRQFRLDINIRRIIRRARRRILLPRAARFSRTPFLADIQRDQIINNRDLPIQVPIALGGRRVEEGLGDTSAFLEGILD